MVTECLFYFILLTSVTKVAIYILVSLEIRVADDMLYADCDFEKLG